MKKEPLFPGLNPTWSRCTNCMLLDSMCYGFCRVFTSVFISGVGLNLRGEVALITFFFFYKMKENGPKELGVFRQLHNRVTDPAPSYSKSTPLLWSGTLGVIMLVP